MQSQCRLSSERLAVFCLEMGMLVRSGVDLSAALNALGADAASSLERDLYQSIHQQMEAGASFSEALAAVGAFPDTMVWMIQLGVESGDLSLILDSMYDYYTREAELEKEIKNACVYPLIMLAIMTAVLFLVVYKVLPVFNGVFLQMGISSPAWLVLLMEIFHVVVSLLIILCVLLGAGLLIVGFESKMGGKQLLTSWIKRVFIRSKINKWSDIGRFYSIMELCVRCGLPMEKAFTFMLQLIMHPQLQEKVKQCQIEYSQGKSISDCVDEMQLLTHAESCLLHLGEQSGEAAMVYRRISDTYMKKAEEKINETVNLLEPLLVGLMCFMAGSILIALMLPLMNAMLVIGGA